MITRGETRRVVGSVAFTARPATTVSRVAYGVEEESQRQGYATEATRSASTALTHEGVSAAARRDATRHVASSAWPVRW
jgi:RimJ/RimL family protein N-acetyltransferase